MNQDPPKTDNKKVSTAQLEQMLQSKLDEQREAGPPPDSPADLMQQQAVSFMRELAELVDRRCKDLPDHMQVPERRAVIVCIRALGQRYAEILKRGKVSSSNRRKVQTAIDAARKLIPPVLFR